MSQPELRRVGVEELEDLAVGAAVLGTGGGGDPHIGAVMAAEAVRRRGPVELVPLDALDDDDLIICSSGMGAPTVIIEKVPDGQEMVRSFRALEGRLGRRARAVMSVEAGGLNSTLPFVTAAELGLPVVDADGMGRAFPELQMMTPTIFGHQASPAALADERGNVVIYDAVDNHWLERLARVHCIEFGSTAYVASYPLTAAQARQAMIPGTISLCLRIGRAIREARASQRDPVDAVLAETGGFRLFLGKVVDVSRRTTAGFARGEALFEGLDEDQGRRFVVRFQNEHLVAAELGVGETHLPGAPAGERVLCSVPDLITLLDAENGSPITTEALRYGFRIQAVAIPCDWRWRLPEGLRLAGPRAFGYDFEYVPVENLI